MLSDDLYRATSITEGESNFSKCVRRLAHYYGAALITVPKGHAVRILTNYDPCLELGGWAVDLSFGWQTKLANAAQVKAVAVAKHLGTADAVRAKFTTRQWPQIEALRLAKKIRASQAK